MPFNNKFLLGVNDGYTFLKPPRTGEKLTNQEALELAALIVTMKPQLREQFNVILNRYDIGE